MTAQATSPFAQGGIIAAGEGSRLRADGCQVSKPMVQVGGRPLIEHAMDRLRAVGIRRVTVIINQASSDCRSWLNHHAGNCELDLVERTTASSYASFKLVAHRLAGAPAVITTVDGIMPIAAFRHFVDAAAELVSTGMVLGLTDHVDDENPLWATLDPADGRIRQLGGRAGSHVTAGLYALPARLPACPGLGFSRLRDYLAWLVAEGHPVRGIALGRVFDIDRMSDVWAADHAVNEQDARSNRA